ncbi:MAG: VWA domain-containing protein, partial [Actinomycetota bacterium]
VLLSDGLQNAGDAELEAEALKRQGIVVDVVETSGVAGDDAAVVEVDVPSRVRVGDSFEIEATLSATTAMQGTLTLRRDGREVARREVSLEPGEQSFSFPGKATADAGSPRRGRRGDASAVYRIEFSSPLDSVRQNDSAAGLVLVSGEPRVLVVEGAPKEGDAIANALEDRGLIVERGSPASFPSGEELASIDSVVLVDVEAGALTEAQIGTLRGFVRDLGRGLVSVAGESSWSLGDYRGSELEDLLPLTSDIKDPRRRPSIAQVLAIDTSGSMAACHCNPEGSNAGLEGGVNKTDISRTGAANAIAALTEQDEVGVLGFNTRSNFVIPLQQLPPEEVVTEGLASLQPKGGTAIPQALKTAVRALKGSEASLKHIVLFTDGFTNQRILPRLGAWVRKQGITLSVLATGEGSGERLEEMAEAGGGRYYPGRNLYEIPEILMNEVIMATRNYVNEGVFYPKLSGVSAATERLDSTPPLLGYIATSLKPSASTLMTIGKYDDPLLATWRTGLGVATAWTSDAKGRWAARWIGWGGFADFWSDVVRETLPAAAQPGFSTQAVVGDDGLELRVESESPIPAGTQAVARVVGPDGTVTRVELARDGVQGFSGTAPASAAGAYLVSVDLADGGRSLYRETVGGVSS